MKKELLVTINLFILAFNINAYVLSWQNPAPTGDDLYDCFFIDDKTGWAVGDNGTIIHSTDGGIHWETQLFDNKNRFYSVHFIDRNTGWVIGGRGGCAAILATEDGGKHWELQVEYELHLGKDIFFIDSSAGWAVTRDDPPNYEISIFRKTSDKGKTWHVIDTIPEMYFNAIYFLDKQHGWAAGWWISGTSTIYYTEDGGESWVERFEYTNSGLGNSFTALHFFDSLNGIAVGNYGKIATTNTGGKTWDLEIVSDTCNFTDLCFINAETGWLGGNTDDIQLYYTNDGGENWVKKYSKAGNFLKTLCFVDTGKGWLFGEDGIIMATKNGGTEWQSINSSITENDLHAVWFLDNYTGWAVGGSGTILHTKDGGINWALHDTTQSVNLNDIFFIDAEKGYIVGDAGTVLLTEDGGNSWQVKNIGTPGVLRGITFSTPSTGYIAGDGNAYYYTSDGGENWLKQTVDIGGYLEKIDFADSLHGMGVGRVTTLYTFDSIAHYCAVKTIDGGQTWEKSGTRWDWDGYQDSRDIAYVNKDNAYIVGLSKSISWTENGGQNWGGGAWTSSNYYGIHFLDTNNGWVVGENSRAFSAKNDENISIYFAVKYGYDFFDVFFADKDHGWFVGEKGIIVHYKGKQVTNIKKMEQPGSAISNKQFSMSKAFPNPFSTVTNIAYTLEKKCLVTLVVYAVSGRKVITLVDKTQSKGSHNITWYGIGTKGRSLSNGIYYYVLTIKNDHYKKYERKKLIYLH